MTLNLPALALVATLTTAATAQTATPTTPKTPVTHHTATTTAAKTTALPPNIPKVPGIPKPLYSLKYVDIHIGTGPIAEPRKYYTVHYTGWLTDGTKFDSSVDRGTPITFPYGARQVIPGWDTGFEGMHIGGKRRLFIPYQLAYGELGRPPVIPAKSDLIFDIELISISDTPPQPKEAPKPAADPAATKPTTDAAPAGSTTPPAKPATTTTPPDTKTPPHPEGI